MRETEKQIQNLNKASRTDAPLPPSSARPPVGQPKDFKEYAKLMCDIIALAFQTDRSRIATLLLSRDLSGQTYQFLNIRDVHTSSTPSHSNTGAATPEDREVPRRTVRLPHRQARQDAGRRWDRAGQSFSCILFVSEHWDAHNGTKVPVALAGGLGGTLKTGRSLDYLSAGDDKRKPCCCTCRSRDRMGLELNSLRGREGAAWRGFDWVGAAKELRKSRPFCFADGMLWRWSWSTLILFELKANSRRTARTENACFPPP